MGLPDSFPQIGRRFSSSYTMTSELGRGASSIVFRAADAGRGRDVAIKVFLPLKGAAAARQDARFDREASVLRQLDSDNVVRLLEYGRSADGLLFMVFDLIGGADLSQVTLDRRWPAAVVRHVLEQLLGALHDAHSLGVLHRDIKPANIRLHERDGDPYHAVLLDFGIAKPTAASVPALTGTNEVVGTLRFLAPEQLFGGELTPAADLFSLGLVAFEMLTGRPSNHLEAIAAGRPVKLTAEDCADPLLVAVVNRMLEPEPGDRYASAQAAIRAMDETISVVMPVVEPARSGRVPLAIGALAVLGVGVAGWYLSRDPPAPPVAEIPAALRQVSASPPVAVEEPVVAEPDAAPVEPARCAPEPAFRGTGRLRAMQGLDSVALLTHIPDSYDPEVPMPLVIMVHQWGESPAAFLDVSKMSNLADSEGFLIIAPKDGELYPWSDPNDIDIVTRALELAQQELCVDASRIYGLGNGDGGVIVEQMACEFGVAAIATTAFRNRSGRRECDWSATKAVPLLSLNPTKDGYNPVDGGAGCGDGDVKISLADKEKLWRERYKCRGKARRKALRDGACYEWKCDAPLVSCHVEGGHGWPGAPGRPIDFQNCDGTPSNFPFGETIWAFFAKHSG